MYMDGRNKNRIVMFAVTEQQDQKYIYQLILSFCLFTLGFF